MKKILALLSVIFILFSLSSCKEKEVTHKTGWQNPDVSDTEKENTTKENTTEETTVAEDVAATSEPEKEEISIELDTGKALLIGSFNSEIYGRLTVYNQNNYFIITDEYNEKTFYTFSQNYSPEKTGGEPEAIFVDMNFDGYTDIGVCYYKDSLNSYYFCFVWDNEEREFTYCLPFSSLPNPRFNTRNKTITAYEKLGEKTKETVYIYTNSELSVVSTKETEETTSAQGAEIVNANLRVSKNGSFATVYLTANEKTQSKWVCTIDDSDVVDLSSEYYNMATKDYEFTLSAIAPGATTVIFRYVSLVTGEYIEEVIINAHTLSDGTVDIIVP